MRRPNPWESLFRLIAEHLQPQPPEWLTTAEMAAAVFPRHADSVKAFRRLYAARQDLLALASQPGGGPYRWPKEEVLKLLGEDHE